MSRVSSRTARMRRILAERRRRQNVEVPRSWRRGS